MAMVIDSRTGEVANEAGARGERESDALAEADDDEQEASLEESCKTSDSLVAQLPAAATAEDGAATAPGEAEEAVAAPSDPPHDLQNGACARVFVATVPTVVDSEPHARIVVKEFRNSEYARREMDREVRALRALGCAGPSASPFLVRLLYTQMPRLPDQLPCVGLEFYPGGDLYSLIREHDLSEIDIGFYVAEIAVALEYVHAHNIVHGDVKPENVCIAADGHVRLIDFGLASELLPATETDDLNDVERGLKLVVSSSGTLDYASPEQIMRVPHGHEIDWWGLGVVFFDLVFGMLPFSSPDPDTQAAAICTAKVKFPDHVAASVEACHLALSLLRKDRCRRLCFAAGAQELKTHAFFSWIDWTLLESRGYQAPFVPSSTQVAPL